MNERMLNIRLSDITEECTALQSALESASQGMGYFLESHEHEDTDSVFYGKETIDGVSHLLESIKQDIYHLLGSISEEDDTKKSTDLPGIDTQSLK